VIEKRLQVNLNTYIHTYIYQLLKPHLHTSKYPSTLGANTSQLSALSQIGLNTLAGSRTDTKANPSPLILIGMFSIMWRGV